MLVSSVTTSRQASPSAPPRKLASSPFGEEGGFTLERPRSQTNLVTNETKGRARCPSDRSEVSRDGESGGETPSMADHSSNNTPDRGRRSKTKVTRRRGGGRRRGQLLGTSDEEGSDSAFPARTPEQVKALDDLLEEEDSPGFWWSMESMDPAPAP